MNFRKRAVAWRALVMLAGTLLMRCICPAATPSGDSGTNRFGFVGPEVFPVDFGIGELHAADLDGDGLKDLIVVNNARSRINILYNQTGKTNAALRAPRGVKKEINELPADARFRIDSIASEKRISSLVVEDLNGDGRPDIAYYGEPKELIVQYNQGTNGWSAPKRYQIDDGQLSSNALEAGDLNGDGRADLILLSDNCIYLLLQKSNGTLAEPERIPFTGSVKAAQIVDVDGDGRNDLMLVNWDSLNPFRFRLQNAAGVLGPEIHLSMPPIRSYWSDDLDGDHKTEIITIATQSGRAQISNFRQKPPEALSGEFKEGQFQVQPLNKSSKSRRGVVWADINGDGREDLLVAEPDSGQLSLFLQKADGSLDTPKTFSTFTGVSEIAVADWDGDGKNNVFLLSADERQVGVTQMDSNGRLPFPQIISLEGRPLTIAAGKVQADGKPMLAIITDQDGKKDLVLRSADGKATRQRLGDNFKSNPVSMTIHDANQDGLADLVILIPYEKIKILLQAADADKPFQEVDVAPPGGTVDQPWLSTADVDGDGKPELLLGQKNFIRSVVLQAESEKPGSTNKASWTFRVKDQINGAASNSRITAVAAVPQAGRTVPSLFLLDAERKTLTLCDRDKSGVWQVIKNITVPVTDFSSLQGIALGSKTPNAVAFIGSSSVAWLALAGPVWQIEELDGYETPIKGGYLNDVVTGDLNQDGRKDLVFLETAKNYVDIVTFETPHRLVPANRWQVFEERTFRSRRADMAEPREALIADVTGDGKNDLILIVHDRIVLYPQD